MIQWKGVRAAVFDLDGTLIDSMEIWREVDEAFFARRGMPVPDGYQEAIAHLGFAECAAFTRKHYLPAERCEDMIEEWRALSLARYNAADGARYFKPGAVSLLRLLRGAGVRLCVATASSPEFYLPVLRAGGAEELFDAYATVAEAGKNKSFPAVFLLAAEKLNVPPSSCVVFEDNLTALRAAKAAGMQAAAVLDGQPPEALAALRAEADEFIASFEEFAASLPRRAE